MSSCLELRTRPSLVRKSPKTIVEHAVWILEIAGDFMDVPSLVSRVLEVGCARKAKNPDVSVRTCLADELRRNPTPRLVKLDNKYGLRSWIEIKTPPKHK